MLRPARFNGQSYVIQYRCLDETVVCTACKQSGHFNGPKCPMNNRCFTCNEEGHQRRNCPKKAELAPTTAPAPVAKPPAPPPPPADANTLQSTGLPSLGGSTWGSFDPGVSEIEMRSSKSPHRSLSSTRSIVSVERQTRLEKTIRGGKIHSEALREKMKEKKRREKEAKMQGHGLMLQCVSQSSQDEIPQTDGPSDTPVPTNYDQISPRFRPIIPQCQDCGIDGENIDWTGHSHGVCQHCPILRGIWCKHQHVCPSENEQIAKYGLVSPAQLVEYDDKIDIFVSRHFPDTDEGNSEDD